MRVILSGAAPLASHVEEYLRVVSCAHVLQGYGTLSFFFFLAILLKMLKNMCFSFYQPLTASSRCWLEKLHLLLTLSSKTPLPHPAIILLFPAFEDIM